MTSGLPPIVDLRDRRSARLGVGSLNVRNQSPIYLNTLAAYATGATPLPPGAIAAYGPDEIAAYRQARGLPLQMLCRLLTLH